jgi:PPOX class probable F420-dependent enzyme
VLPGLDGDAAARAVQRLNEQSVLWLTTVTPNGQPQSSPVGYVWDGTTFLIISAPGTPKVRNLRVNDKVSLHLDLDTTSETNSVLTIEGVAVLDPDGTTRLSAEETKAYLDRHLEAIEGAGMTPGEAFAELSTVIRVTPTRARSY